MTISFREINSLAITFNNTAIATVQDITAKHDEAMRSKKLTQGCFYGNEYYKALTELDKTALKTALVHEGAFFHGRPPLSHFNLIKTDDSISGYKVMAFTIKNGVRPSEALAALRRGFSIIDCRVTCEIAYLQSLQKVLGVAKFNALFAADSKTPLTFNQSFGSLAPLMTPLKRFIQPGRLYYFKNIDLMPLRHHNSDGNGFVTICISASDGVAKFTTLGLPSSGATMEEIAKQLHQEYEAEPVGVEILSPEMTEKLKLSVSTVSLEGYSEDLALFTPPSNATSAEPATTLQMTDREGHSHEMQASLPATIPFDIFQRHGGGRLDCSFEPDYIKISKLTSLSIENARARLEEWQAALNS